MRYHQYYYEEDDGIGGSSFGECVKDRTKEKHEVDENEGQLGVVDQCGQPQSGSFQKQVGARVHNEDEQQNHPRRQFGESSVEQREVEDEERYQHVENFYWLQSSDH